MLFWPFGPQESPKFFPAPTFSKCPNCRPRVEPWETSKKSGSPDGAPEIGAASRLLKQGYRLPANPISLFPANSHGMEHGAPKDHYLGSSA
jgi:hypothetical protein